MLLPDPSGTDIFEGFDFLMAPRVYRRNLLFTKTVTGCLGLWALRPAFSL